MNEILSRVKELYTHLDMSSRAFALEIGFNYSTLTGYLLGRRATLDVSLIERILSTFDNLSAEWLMRGRGDMFLNTQSESYVSHNDDNISSNDTINNDRISKLIDTIAFQQGTITSQSASLAEAEAKVKELERQLSSLRSQKNVI